MRPGRRVAELRAKAFFEVRECLTEVGREQRLRAVRRLPKARRPASRRAWRPRPPCAPIIPVALLVSTSDRWRGGSTRSLIASTRSRAKPWSRSGRGWGDDAVALARQAADGDRAGLQDSQRGCGAGRRRGHRVRRAEGGLPRAEPGQGRAVARRRQPAPYNIPRPSSSPARCGGRGRWTSTSCCKRTRWTAWPPHRAARTMGALGDAAVAL